MPESGTGVPDVGPGGPQTVTAARHRPSRRAILAGGLGLAAVAAAGLGVVIALHGSGGSPATLAPGMARAMARAQVTRFAIICVDGGETYWHKRADGDDPAGMIVHEVLPRAAAAGMHTGRIGIVGLSMARHRGARGRG